MVSKRNKIIIIILLLSAVFATAWFMESNASPLNSKNINQNIRDVLKQYDTTKGLINAMTVALAKKDNKIAKPPTCNPFLRDDESNLTKPEDQKAFELYIKDLIAIRTNITILTDLLKKYRIEDNKLQMNIDKTDKNANWVEIESIVTPDLVISMKEALTAFTKDMVPFLESINKAPPCNTYCGATEDTKWTGDGTVYPTCICTTGYTNPKQKGDAIKCFYTLHSAEADQLINQYNSNIDLINKNFALASKDSEGCTAWNIKNYGAC